MTKLKLRRHPKWLKRHIEITEVDREAKEITGLVKFGKPTGAVYETREINGIMVSVVLKCDTSVWKGGPLEPEVTKDDTIDQKIDTFPTPQS